MTHNLSLCMYLHFFLSSLLHSSVTQYNPYLYSLFVILFTPLISSIITEANIDIPDICSILGEWVFSLSREA
jgi:hypothetical protein